MPLGQTEVIPLANTWNKCSSTQAKELEQVDLSAKGYEVLTARWEKHLLSRRMCLCLLDPRELFKDGINKNTYVAIWKKPWSHREQEPLVSPHHFLLKKRQCL